MLVQTERATDNVSVYTAKSEMLTRESQFKSKKINFNSEKESLLQSNQPEFLVSVRESINIDEEGQQPDDSDTSF